MPQADGQAKNRPAIILREMPPYHDWLVCGTIHNKQTYYPEDKYTPSCLLLGFTTVRRPLHLQVSYADTPLLKIVTLYEPDEEQWINYEHR